MGHFSSIKEHVSPACFWGLGTLWIVIASDFQRSHHASTDPLGALVGLEEIEGPQVAVAW